MKTSFPGYYRPTKREFASIWSKCLFAFDANVLLSVYRYTPSTRNELLGILKRVGDRLWIPHQAAFEYQKNRLDVITRQANAYERLKEVLQDAKGGLCGRLSQEGSRHPYIDIKALLASIDTFFNEQMRSVDDLRKKHPDLLSGDLLASDRLREELDFLVHGHLGEPYPEPRLREIISLGKTRYQNQVPPGYMDAAKPSNDSYGDLVMWFQIIDKAKLDARPVILVTDERKEDWWWKFQGRTIGPRPELVAEMQSSAAQPFYLYQADQFMDQARQHLSATVKKEAVDEIRTLRLREEELRLRSKIRREMNQIAHTVAGDLMRFPQKRVFSLAQDVLANGITPARLSHILARIPADPSPLLLELFRLTDDPRWLSIGETRPTSHRTPPSEPGQIPTWLEEATTSPIYPDEEIRSGDQMPDWLRHSTGPTGPHGPIPSWLRSIEDEPDTEESPPEDTGG